MRNVVGMLAVIFLLCASVDAPAADWPQWRGPNRDGKSAETGLLKRWPGGGPRLVWSASGLGKGYSQVAVAKGRIYTTGMDRNDGGVLSCFDLDGKLKWRKSYGPEFRKNYSGARSTPTVRDGRVFLMSGTGQVYCFDASTGRKIWSVDGKKRFGLRMIGWGIAESLLVVDDKVICTPGGSRATLAALDAKTGATVWRVSVDAQKSAYCSPILVKDGRMRLIVTMTQNAVVAVAPDRGELIWTQPHHTRYDVHPVTPVYDDGFVYVTSGYGTGGRTYKLVRRGRGATRVWSDRNMDTHHGGVVLVDGFLYGTASRGGRLCIDFRTGRVRYNERRGEKGSVIYADGMLYYYGERSGEVALVRATPNEYRVVSRFRVKRGGGEHWAHPAISDGRLYIRHGDALMAYDIKAK